MTPARRIGRILSLGFPLPGPLVDNYNFLTAPGKGREIQLTDAIAALMEREPVFAYEFDGRRFDTGRPLGLLTASIEIGLRRSDTGPGLREYLRTLPLDD